jgi:hypothetical protein
MEEKETKVKYTGIYPGEAQGISFVPGEVKEVPDEKAKELLNCPGQFKLVKEVKPEDG